jgi:DNA-binding beta-propeller fold protein YncE
MTRRDCLALAAAGFGVRPALGQVKAGPSLPHKLVPDWAKLPKGWNFGECAGVAVDEDDNVWVLHRGAHPVLQFDRHGKLLQSWGDGLLRSGHGIAIAPDRNIWLIDVKGHVLLKCNREGRVLWIIGQRQGNAVGNEQHEGFNEPTAIDFAPNGDLFVSDGYVNSRVVKLNKDGEYITHWGKKGTGDGEFDLVHDVLLGPDERVYVCDRNNDRVQIFDLNGKFLEKWTHLGKPYDLTYFAPEKALYMCDGVNGRIARLSLKGDILGATGSYGSIPGRLTSAHNIAVDSRGDIYVSEIRTWRVQKFAKP